MDAISRPLKIYFLPFFAQGHMIPFSQFARLFAARGHHVTIITTPFNAQLLQNSIDEAKASGHLIDTYTVKFPSEEVGLQDGIENLFNATDGHTANKLYMAAALLQQQVEPFIHHNPPDCIVSDFIFTWTAELANRLKIPRLVFNSFCLFAVCMIEAVNKHLELSESQDDSGPFVVPGLPHPITLTLRPPKQLFQMLEALIQAELNSYGLIVNNFAELDGEEYIEHYKENTGHKIWHIGPASLMLPNKPEKDTSLMAEHECIRWLNSKEPNSVVYISFGSLCRFPDQQLFEIACGIEASRQNFIWVVHREQNQEEESEEDGKKWLPEGFEEGMKTENKGMILREWAPQVLILNHPAIGGFLMQCGWTSVMEGISAGIPMITWPIFAEQFYSEKLITQVHGLGVEVGAEEWIPSPYVSMEKLVSREKIESAVRRLMDSGDEGREVRRKAWEMSEKARKAVKEGGSSQKNLTALIEDLERLKVKRAQN